MTFVYVLFCILKNFWILSKIYRKYLKFNPGPRSPGLWRISSFIYVIGIDTAAPILQNTLRCFKFWTVKT